MRTRECTQACAPVRACSGARARARTVRDVLGEVRARLRAKPCVSRRHCFPTRRSLRAYGRRRRGVANRATVHRRYKYRPENSPCLQFACISGRYRTGHSVCACARERWCGGKEGRRCVERSGNSRTPARRRAPQNGAALRRAAPSRTLRVVRRRSVSRAPPPPEQRLLRPGFGLSQRSEVEGLMLRVLELGKGALV